MYYKNFWTSLVFTNTCIFTCTGSWHCVSVYSNMNLFLKKISLKTLYHYEITWHFQLIIKSVQFKNQELWVNRICCKLLHVLGTLGLKLLHGTSERDHIKDCVSLIKQTVKQLFNGTLTEITDTPTSCKNSSFSWQAGNIILQWVSVVGVGGGQREAKEIMIAS